MLFINVFFLVLLNKWVCSSDQQTEYDAVVQSQFFIDKTQFLKYFMDLQPHRSHILITAPSKFGKTTTLSMLEMFLSVAVHENGTIIPPTSAPTYRIFKNTNIFRSKQFFQNHFAQYPVLRLDFSDTMNLTSYSDYREKMTGMVEKAYAKHGYLAFSPRDGESFNTSLSRVRSNPSYPYSLPLTTLIRLLSYYFKTKCIVLMDELHVPLLTAALSKNISRDNFKVLEDELTDLVTLLVRHNPKYVAKSCLMAILPIGSTDFGKAYNIDIKNIFLDDNVWDFIGYNQTDILYLENKFSILKTDKEIIKKKYNGYKVSNTNMNMFSPASIKDYVNKKIQNGDYVGGGEIGRIEKLFEYKLCGKHIEGLMKNESGLYTCANYQFERSDFLLFRDTIMSHEANVWCTRNLRFLLLQYLTENGYFTITSNIGNEWYLQIPNESAKDAFAEKFFTIQFISEKFKIPVIALQAYTDAVLNLQKQDYYKEVLQTVASLTRPRFYPGCEHTSDSPFIYVFQYSRNKDVIDAGSQNRTVEHGTTKRGNKTDLYVLTRFLCIIVEFKLHAASAILGLQQILSNRYYSICPSERKKILIAFNLKNNNRTLDAAFLRYNYLNNSTFEGREQIKLLKQATLLRTTVDF